jgi:hypothetical protein
MIAAVTPWPARAERKAAVRAAAAEKDRSRRSRTQAKAIETQINQIAAANHWASAVAESLGITSGGDRNGGPK